MSDSDADIKAYYDARVEEKVRDFVTPNPRIEAALETLTEWAPASPRRILEIGCGIGASAWRMARAWPGAQVIGSDISEGSIRVAERCFRLPNLRYHAGAVEPGTFEGQFDLVLMMDVYEHVNVADRSRLHAALQSLLAPECRCVITFPTPRLQSYILENCPHDLQPIDESIGWDVILRLASETTTEVLLYRQMGVWHYGDYAHLVLGRFEGMVDVRLRVPRHPSWVVRLKQRVKRVIGREQESYAREDYLGSDILGIGRRTGTRVLAVSSARRRSVARAWSKSDARHV